MNKLTDLTTSEMKKFAGGFDVGVIVGFCGCSSIVLCGKECLMNKEYKEKILKTGLEGFLIGIAIGVAAGIVYFLK